MTEGTNGAAEGRQGARARAAPRCPRRPRPRPVSFTGARRSGRHGPHPAGTPRRPGSPPSWPPLDPSPRKIPGDSGGLGGRPFPTPPLRGTGGQPGTRGGVGMRLSLCPFLPCTHLVLLVSPARPPAASVGGTRSFPRLLAHPRVGVRIYLQFTGTASSFHCRNVRENAWNRKNTHFVFIYRSRETEGGREGIPFP